MRRIYNRKLFAIWTKHKRVKHYANDRLLEPKTHLGGESNGGSNFSGAKSQIGGGIWLNSTTA